MQREAAVCVVVPTYNEKENVLPLIEEVESVGIPGLCMLFVDDSSPDGTADEITRAASTRPWVRLLQRPGKMGLGSAYQDGFREAIAATNAEIIVEMDADLQHPASALPSLVGAIGEGADVAVGSRYVPGGGAWGWGLGRRTISRAANAYSRLLLGLSVRDATSGFRAYRRSAAESVANARLPAKGFEFQVAALHLLRGRAAVVEVPFAFTSRSAGKSKLRLADVLRFFFALLRMAL